MSQGGKHRTLTSHIAANTGQGGRGRVSWDDNKNNKYHFLDEQKFKTDLINILGK